MGEDRDDTAVVLTAEMLEQCWAFREPDVNLDALEQAFRNWRANNSHALELDGVGDVYALLVVLMASAAKQKA
jgi:hypothetical protein